VPRKLAIRGNSWRVHVFAGRGRRHAFRIAIMPAEGVVWPSPFGRVSLTGDELTREAFTGAWKAFEAKLSRLGVRADLVQLSGYHSYRSAMDCEMEAAVIPAPKFGWMAVLGVVGGKGVGKVLAEADRATTWGIPRKHVLAAARFLKGLGYEVRSHNMNARIPAGNLLVPYAFPTLSPKSIQLYKGL
jgi:DNA (cytosine-5)-methyltransferase 1